uniref:Putative methyltransferase n=1 Tax=viral metagenome TaxID=1070528 RepID=A0A6M3IP30_9ZZZZ
MATSQSDAPKTRLLRKALKDLVGAPYNPRRISAQALAGLSASIERFGLVQPIIWNVRTDHVVGGHQRIRAPAAQGVTEADVVVVDLPEPEERALNVALNSPAISGEFTDSLDGLLLELKAADPELFDQVRLEELASASLREAMNEAAGQTDPDAVPMPPDAACSRRGAVYRLGAHRLMCGDSANVGDVDRLLAGAPVHLVNTDPPYNVKVEPRSNNAIAAGLSSFSHTKNPELARDQARGAEAKPSADAKKLKTATHHQGLGLARHPEKSQPTHAKMRPKDRPLENDFVTDAEFDDLLAAWFGNLARVLLPGRAFYIWGGYANCGNYPPVLKAMGLYFSQAVIWDKQHPVLTRKDFMGAHEWCFYGWREGAAHQFFGPANAQDLWHIKKVNPQSMIHLTEKPVELATRAMEYSSKAGENVLDLFGGSGSTLIGAQMRKRCAFLMEIDELYCDVIRRRWAEFVHGEGCDWQRLTPEAPDG